jgi:flagellar biosynthesis GTPase FlhF
MDAVNMDAITDTSPKSNMTLYIVIFFLCVISAVIGYFQMSLAGVRAEADKSAAVKDAQLEADKKILADKEAKLKKAEELVNKKLAEATASVKEANNLKNAAKKVKADADKKKKEADDAMKRAEETNDENLKKLAAEKKKIADDAAKKVKQAQDKAKKAEDKAKKEAEKALGYKNELNKANKTIKKLNDVEGQFIYLVHGNTSQYINLAEIIVWTSKNKKVKIDVNKIKAAKPYSSKYIASKFADGKTDTMYHSKKNVEQNDWIRVDLGKTVPITKIQIINREDCCRDRISGIKCYIQDSKKKNVKTLPTLRGKSAKYTIDPNGSLGWIKS